MILEWFPPKEFYKLSVSVEKKSERFPYFCKNYCQRKIGTFLWATLYVLHHWCISRNSPKFSKWLICRILVNSSFQANNITRAQKSAQGIDREHNWELLITHPPLCLTKTRPITTTFLISNTLVPNPYSHGTTFDPQFNIKFKVHLMYLPQSYIQILHGLKIDNGIQQCVSSSWIGIF